MCSFPGTPEWLPRLGHPLRGSFLTREATQTASPQKGCPPSPRPPPNTPHPFLLSRPEALVTAASAACPRHLCSAPAPNRRPRRAVACVPLTHCSSHTWSLPATTQRQMKMCSQVQRRSALTREPQRVSQRLVHTLSGLGTRPGLWASYGGAGGDATPGLRRRPGGLPGVTPHARPLRSGKPGLVKAGLPPPQCHPGARSPPPLPGPRDTACRAAGMTAVCSH